MLLITSSRNFLWRTLNLLDHALHSPARIEHLESPQRTNKSPTWRTQSADSSICWAESSRTLSFKTSSERYRTMSRRDQTDQWASEWTTSTKNKYFHLNRSPRCCSRSLKSTLPLLFRRRFTIASLPFHLTSQTRSAKRCSMLQESPVSTVSEWSTKPLPPHSATDSTSRTCQHRKKSHATWSSSTLATVPSKCPLAPSTKASWRCSPLLRISLVDATSIWCLLITSAKTSSLNTKWILEQTRKLSFV